jgi:hypothetical protein
MLKLCQSAAILAVDWVMVMVAPETSIWPLPAVIVPPVGRPWVWAVLTERALATATIVLKPFLPTDR